MHIGLIGGIGPAATDYYYRRLIRALAGTGSDLDLTIAHADSPTLLRNLAAGDTAAQAAIFERLAHRLMAAGAQSVAVTAIAGHRPVVERRGKASQRGIRNRRHHGNEDGDAVQDVRASSDAECSSAE